ncbi:MAG: type II secretion system protein M [Magnetococcales bacterium]|nr:type II secretion system protein M [Magnetococcales bacterium]
MRWPGWLSWPARGLASLAPRERRVVVGGGLVLVALLVEMWVIEPGLEWLEGRRRVVAEKSATLAWMKNAAQEVTRLKAAGLASQPSAAGGNGATGGGESLLALADRTARERGLGGALRRVEPEGSGRVRLWFEKVTFEGLMGWLSELDSRHGARAENITLDREESPGQVSSRVVLAWPERPGGQVRGAER